ncbi:MAG TPA: carboxyvinyl-carboxyphosphonate phosphorylmutase [Rhodospirillales bacterium]|nr:carboxyvinyl-carboxyphosphonate phosphorylmutase [Rhodospirillales bacterium]
MSPQSTLRNRLGKKKILVVPGIYDAFGAIMAERAGFEALYLSGASIAYTKLGSPDIGLITLNELESVVGNVCERSALPIIVDADTGFGNALNVQRTIKLLERAGAAAIQIEDQSLPKRCGHLDGKTLVNAFEMNGKIKAALDARSNNDTVIIARTDAIGVEGYDLAMERAAGFIESGADILFIEAFQNVKQIAGAVEQFGDKIPLLVNMVEGGKTPMLPAAELETMGFSVVIFPGGLVRAIAHTAEQYFASLNEMGSTRDYQNRMFNFKELNELLGTDRILEAGKQYGDGGG